MELILHKEQEVNKHQYQFIKSKCSHLIAYRQTDTKYLIKPLLFLGNKKVIESILNKLK